MSISTFFADYYPPRPVTRLLQLLQRDMLKDTAFSQSLARKKQVKKEVKEANEKDAEEKLQNFVLYARFMIERSSQLLETALDINKRLSVAKSESSRDETEEKETAVGLDSQLKRLLEQSVIMTVLRPLITTLCLFLKDTSLATSSNYYRISSAMLPLFMRLLFAIDSLNSKADDVVCMEMSYLEKEKQKMLMKCVDRKKVETPHNYYPNTDEEKVVKIPGATHLCITFDDRCSLVCITVYGPPQKHSIVHETVK